MGKLVLRNHGSLFEIVVFFNTISGSVLLIGNEIARAGIDNRRLRNFVLAIFRTTRAMPSMTTTLTLRPALFATGGTRFGVLHPCGNLVIVTLVEPMPSTMANARLLRRLCGGMANTEAESTASIASNPPER